MGVAWIFFSRAVLGLCRANHRWRRVYSLLVIFRYNRNGVNLQLVNSNPTSTQQAPNKYPTSTQQVLELVGILKDVEYSVREIMSSLMLKDRVNFLYKYLTPALEEGLVSMKYPDNPKHPKQKYMLTEKGRKILEK